MDKIFEWKIAFRNLFRNKRRTLATVSAIVTGFCGLGLLGGYIIRSEKYLKVSTIYINELGHFSVYAPKGVDLFYINPKKYQIKEETITKVYQIFNEPEFVERIEFTGKYISGIGLISSGKNSLPFIAKGVDPEVSAYISQHPLVKKWTHELSMSNQGVDFSSAVKADPGSVSVTKDLGALLGLQLPFTSEPMEKREVQLAGRTIYGDLNSVNGVVTLSHTTGLSLSEDTGLLAPLQLLKDLYAIDGISHIAVFLKDGVSISSTMIKLNQRLHELNIDLEVIPFNDERIGQFYTGTMSFLFIMAFFFVFLICSAVAISIVNAMTMGILERSREIGTMRSIGLSEQTIIRLFTKEAILMTGLGIIVGTILTIIISSGVTSLNIRFTPPGIAGTMQFVLTPEPSLCISISMLMLIVSGFTGYFVAKNKARIKIVNLLTDVER